MNLNTCVGMDGRTFVSVETPVNDLVDDAVETVIQEAIKHFSKIKRTIRDPEEDARYFWNDYELNTFLREVKYPDRVWVSTIKDNQGKFYAYRVGRIIENKKRGVVKV